LKGDHIKIAIKVGSKTLFKVLRKNR